MSGMMSLSAGNANEPACLIELHAIRAPIAVVVEPYLSDATRAIEKRRSFRNAISVAVEETHIPNSAWQPLIRRRALSAAAHDGRDHVGQSSTRPVDAAIVDRKPSAVDAAIVAAPIVGTAATAEVAPAITIDVDAVVTPPTTSVSSV